MAELLNEFNKILVDLQNLDVKILDKNKALLLMNSLTDLYEHLTTTIIYGKTEIKFEDISNVMMNNDYQKLDTKIPQDYVLVVQGSLKIGIKTDKENLLLSLRRNILIRMSAPNIVRKVV